MKWLLFLLASYCWLGSTLITQAAVFERDWKTPGDGLLTYDDVNNREWLDLTETLDFPGAAPPVGRNFEPRVQSVLAELGPGGLFEGFSLAGRNDVAALAESAGIDTTVFDFATNGTAAEKLIDLLGENLTFPFSDQRFTSGFMDEGCASEDLCTNRIAAFFLFNPGSSANGLGYSSGSDAIGASGVMLYRAVPEPSSVIFTLTAGIFLLACNRYQKSFCA